MTLAALVLAQMLGLAGSQTSPAAEVSRYHVSDLAESIEHDASRYRLVDFSTSVDGDAFRYQLAEFSQSVDDASRYRLTDFSRSIDGDASRYHLSEFCDAVERDVERCICTTIRLSPATLKSEVLLVSDCECGK